ncbi:MAG: response regulator transcription factor [Balneolaceae bacterium]
MNAIHVHIADVSEILRSGLEQLLRRSVYTGDITLNPGAHSLISSYEKQPDAVCIISSGLSDMSLKDTIHQLSEINPAVKMVVISGAVSITHINTAMNLGVQGYITRNASAEELEEVIVNVWNNEQAFSRNVSDAIVGHYANTHKPENLAGKHTPITNREQEILEYIVEGLTSSEIAQQLYISPRTVETHRANLMQKLNIKNTAGLVRFALSSKENM